MLYVAKDQTPGRRVAQMLSALEHAAKAPIGDIRELTVLIDQDDVNIRIQIRNLRFHCVFEDILHHSQPEF